MWSLSRWQLKFDHAFLMVTLFLIGLGLVQVYSASYIYAIESYGDGMFFFRKQLMYAVVGLVALIFCINIDWKYLKWVGVALWVIGVLGTVATFIPSLTLKAGGAARWIRLPFDQRFEPGELLKITYPFIFAVFLSYRDRLNGSILKVVVFGILLSPLFLLLKQPDFGTFVICLLCIFSVAFIHGLKWRFIALAGMTILPLFYFLVINVPYRLARLKVFIDPWADPENRGFQIIQSMLSFYSGGLSGVGIGESQGKLFFLPEAHTDFTLAIFAEEWGFVGVFLVALLYGFLILRGLKISMHAENIFSRNVALGIVTVFALSVFINIGVVMGMLPTKGLTLPFISYGGSSLVSMCLALGILLNIDKSSRFRIKDNSKKFKPIQ
ncbi:MAG: cell division protein FtsW [Bdellovibrionales bacterium]|nr:cell division protein FtsW [Bdellovibrionales bacterium]